MVLIGLPSASGEQMTEEKIMEMEECRIVREAVKRLPDKYRLPVLLFYMEELSLSDISKILNLSAGTVKSRIHRATAYRCIYLK